MISMQAGDSAGGGLSLALLQVIRDTGLPMPAGAVLISPVCILISPPLHRSDADSAIHPVVRSDSLVPVYPPGASSQSATLH